ncbi:MAG: AI-2E family transporter [Bacteroidota bacterium]
MDNVSKNILIIFFIIVVFYLLSALSSILIPLVLALLFAVLFQPFLQFMKKHKIPDFLGLPIVAIISLVILLVITNILISTISDVAAEQNYLLVRLDEKINALMQFISSATGLKINQGFLNKEFNNLLSSDWLGKTAGGLASGLSSLTGSFIMFGLYYVIILSGMSGYKKYIQYVGGDSNERLFANFEKVQKSVISFILLKTLVNICAGVAATLICIAFGVKFPLFWGFVTFMFDYIPTIGSLIATVPPALMGLIQFDEIKTALLLFACLSVVQFTIGNILEPKIIGNRLRLNTVTVIFGLVFWGYLWGIPGMMLSVPLMVILKLIFENNQSLSILARVMGYPEKMK